LRNAKEDGHERCGDWVKEVGERGRESEASPMDPITNFDLTGEESLDYDMEGVLTGAPGSDSIRENLTEAPGTSFEAIPVAGDSQDIASDNIISNFDVITQLKRISKIGTVRWILEHECCPKEYREKSLTKEGYKMAVHLVTLAIYKLKRIVVKLTSRRKPQLPIEFRNAPFEFPPWRDEKFGEKERERLKQIVLKREADEARQKELRSQLVEKEGRLKKLKAEKELAPNQKFLEICEIARKRKKAAETELRQEQKELKDVSEAFSYYAEKLPEASKRKKNTHDALAYYKHRLKTIITLGDKAGAAERKNAATKELLQHEIEQLKVVKSDRRELQSEREELSGELSDLRETAFFDAMTEVAGARAERVEEEMGKKKYIKFVPTEEVDEKKHSQSLKRRFKPEMMDIVKDLIEIGVPIESVESVVETVFESINFSVRRFPSSSVIHKICKRDKKK